MTYKENIGKLWIAAGNKTKEREYWLDKLAGKLHKSSFPATYEIEKKPGKPSLPLTRTVNFRFNTKISSDMIKVSTGSDIRLYILLTAVLSLLLRKYTGNNDIIISAPILKPDTRKNDSGEELINKVLILRILLTDHMSFKELLLRVRRTIIEAVTHQNYPIEVLLKQLNLSAPPSEVALLLENIHDKQFLSNVKPGIIFSFLRTDGIIQGHVEYRVSAYHQQTVARFIDHYQHLAEVVLDNAEIKVSAVEVLFPEEKKQLLYDFNHPEEEYPADKTIQELFEKQVEKTPERIVVVGTEAAALHSRNRSESPGSETPAQGKNYVLSYRELDRRADHVARSLIERGVKPADIVAITIERSVEMIIGILGILKAGAAYLPINPRSPAERTRYMLSDSSTGILLTTRSFVKEVEELGSLEVETMFIEEPGSRQDAVGIREKQGRGESIIAQSAKSIAHSKSSQDPCHAPCALRSASSYENLSYIIYTSGSTGEPKGVPITHANFSPLMHWGYRHLRIGPADRVIQNLSFYFDWSVWEIFITLTSGAALYMITDDILLNPEAEVDFILKNEITVLHITPTQYQYLINVGKKLDTLRYLAIGAEKLTFDLMRRGLEFVNEDCRVFNMYGPTEATIMSAVLEIDRTRVDEYSALSSVPIGGTIANTTLLVLDKHMKLCPIGVPGELYIAGCALSKGYLNDLEKSRKSFIENIFEAQGIKGRYLYKTGDRVRWLPDSTLEFLGRMDFQVKIRGFRIEPGEIENQLLNHPEVKEALVIARQYENGEGYLCAYIVGDVPSAAAPVVAGIRDYLSAQLPDYMVPSYFISLDKMPLNPNGKVDLKALPIPGVGKSAVPYAAPCNAKEKRMAQVWAEVLDLKSIPGIDDDFFELGGHSLKVTALVSRIYKEFEVNIDIEDVFANPTIRGLAKLMERLDEEEYLEIPHAEKKDYYTLSSAQERLFILQQFDMSDISYNMPAVFVIHGKLDKEKFEKVIQELIKRHETLRTFFCEIENETVQKIEENTYFRIEYEKINEENDIKTKIRDFVKPFDLTKPPLLRVLLIEQTKEKYFLLFDIHHIISDGSSLEILIDEFARLLEGENLRPLPVQYKDYTAWQQRLPVQEKRKEQEKYWLEKLAGFVFTQLPINNFRSYKRVEGKQEPLIIDSSTDERIERFCSRHNITKFVFLVTVFGITLSRELDQSDITFGIPVSLRNHFDLERLIGIFLNVVLIRTIIDENDTFLFHLSKSKENIIAALDNQDYPYEMLDYKMRENGYLKETELFSILFNYFSRETGDEIITSDIEIRPYNTEEVSPKYDITLYVYDTPGCTRMNLVYKANLYKKYSIRVVLDNLLNIIHRVLENEKIKLSDIESPVCVDTDDFDKEFEKYY